MTDSPEPAPAPGLAVAPAECPQFLGRLRGQFSRPVTDAILAAAAGIAAFVISSTYDLEERWHFFADRYEAYFELDELPMAFLVVGVMFAWFAWRRWGDFAQAAEERRIANDALSDQLVRNEEVIADLSDARENALQLDLAKTRFLAHMSHELRTPLNAIIGFSELMQFQGYETLGAENYANYTGSIRDSGHHLLDLINDLLDLSRIESGDLTPTDSVGGLESIATAATQIFTERAATAGVRLTHVKNPAGKIHALLDVRMIRQVLINLLSNAIRHTPDGGSVDIAAYANDDGSFGFTVTDTGEGMDIRAANRARTGFGEVENAMRREHHGAGLGLPLSRSIMQAHGGNLTLTSTKGAGTRIDLWLPAGRVVADEPQDLAKDAALSA